MLFVVCHLQALHSELVSTFRDRLCNTNDTDKFDHILWQTLRKAATSHNNKEVYTQDIPYGSSSDFQDDYDLSWPPQSLFI